MTPYRKRSTEVEAIELNEANAAAIEALDGVRLYRTAQKDELWWADVRSTCGLCRARPGDFIVRERSELSVFTAEDFAASFEGIET